MQEVCGLSQTLKAETYIHPSVAHYRYHINFQIRWISFGSLELSNNKFFVTSKELSFAGTLLQTPQKLQTIERWRLECSTEKKDGKRARHIFQRFYFHVRVSKGRHIQQVYWKTHLFTSSIFPQLLHWSACSEFLMKLACQIAFIFIASKVIFSKNVTQARPCNNSGETEDVAFFVLPCPNLNTVG